MTHLDSAVLPQADLRASALASAAQGRYRDAIRLATLHVRAGADEELERLLVSWRMAAFAELAKAGPNEPWPPAYADPFPGLSGLPEIPAAELTTQVLAGAILHHGALLVRGLVSEEDAAKFRPGIDQAFDAFSAWLGNRKTPPNRWFSPAPIPADTELAKSRHWQMMGGGCWAADSPHMLFELVELLERTGVVGMVGEYLGEKPALSVGKTTLRKIPAGQKNSGWHQDGQFLGIDVRSVNFWLALSPCGRDAPGIDLVPKRIPYIVETGTHGAEMPWIVGPGLVDSLAADAPVTSPEFAAGDALLFDHLFLHRTGLPPNRTLDRWAIEAWMFAPSHYPLSFEPLVL
jgi:hypothetical protein